MRNLWIAGLSVLLVSMAQARGGELVVQLPDAVNVKSASAKSRQMKAETPGRIAGGQVVFPNLLPETPYDLTITLADGTVFCGADMSWYNEEQADPQAPALDEDDRKQIQAILDLPSFYDKSTILMLRGSRDRAVVLVELLRTRDFFLPDGKTIRGQAIWRVELYYFRYQSGGWEKIRQSNQVLRRERFKKTADLEVARQIKWTPELGGIRLPKDQEKVTLKFPAGKEAAK